MKSVLKYPGSKWRIAPWIVSHFPQHEIYLEPFFGSGAVFFTKERSKLEVVNDLDQNVYNFFMVLRKQPQELAEQLYLTPYSREEYETVLATGGMPYEECLSPLEKARRFAVRCWQNTGTVLAHRSGWKHDVSQARSNSAHHWNRLPERIAPIAERLKDAQIENRDAFEVIKKFNHEDTLIYVDPPYLKSSRRGNIYLCEMQSDAEHIALLELLKRHKGNVVLSGYDNALYNQYLTGWKKDSIKARAQNNTERIECIWMNF